MIYLVLWIYGLVIDHDSGANFVAINGADNWLHVLLGAGMLALGLTLRGATPGGIRSDSAGADAGRVDEPVAGGR